MLIRSGEQLCSFFAENSPPALQDIRNDHCV
jgi:hypothetical protein